MSMTANAPSASTTGRVSEAPTVSSARTAIPHGRLLAPLEMETLIDQLFACDEPYTDPFGKPTLIYMPMEDIRRKFR